MFSSLSQTIVMVGMIIEGGDMPRGNAGLTKGACLALPKSTHIAIVTKHTKQ